MASPRALDKLLLDVRKADRQVRIELRDAVAAYGSAAIEPMVSWIPDAEFSRFAVRVLEKIAQTDWLHDAAIAALQAGHAAAPTPEIASDVEETLLRLGTKVRKTPARKRAVASAAATA
jgi:hypothetical protein